MHCMQHAVQLLPCGHFIPACSMHVNLLCAAPHRSTPHIKNSRFWRHGRGTVLLGFEQTNKYTVLDQDGNTVALMAEDTGGLGTAVGRQLMKRRRSFTATVFSPDGGARQGA